MFHAKKNRIDFQTDKNSSEMKLSEFQTYFYQMLPAFYDEEERKALFTLVAEEVLDYSRADIVLKKEEVLSKDSLDRLEEILIQLQQEVPIQYIFQKAYFYGYEFKVSSATLIPRRETEELVEWVLETMNNQPNKRWRVLDIGTGSGCIPISIKMEFPLAEVYAMDVSVEALKVAKENSENLNTEVTLIQQDILLTDGLESFDIIVSNPPYVRILEKTEIKNNVLNYEPHLALFVEDDDPLIFYRKIAQLARKSLSKDGYLFFEINQYLGDDMKELLSEYFQTMSLRQDLQGNDRMMKLNQSENNESL